MVGFTIIVKLSHAFWVPLRDSADSTHHQVLIKKPSFLCPPKKWAKWRHPKKSQRRSIKIHPDSKRRSNETNGNLWRYTASPVAISSPIPSVSTVSTPLGSGAGTMMEMDVRINADEDSMQKTMILAFGQHHRFLFGEVSHIRSQSKYAFVDSCCLPKVPWNIRCKIRGVVHEFYLILYIHDIAQGTSKNGCETWFSLWEMFFFPLSMLHFKRGCAKAKPPQKTKTNHITTPSQGLYRKEDNM